MIICVESVAMDKINELKRSLRRIELMLKWCGSPYKPNLMRSLRDYKEEVERELGKALLEQELQNVPTTNLCAECDKPIASNAYLCDDCASGPPA